VTENPHNIVGDGAGGGVGDGGGGDRATDGRSEFGTDFFEQLVETAPDGIVVVDARGIIRLANRQSESLFGWRRDDLIGKPIELLVPDRVRRAHPDHRARYTASPRTRPMAAGLELTARKADGSEFPVDISLSPLDTGVEVWVSAAIRDATARKRAEPSCARPTSGPVQASPRWSARAGNWPRSARWATCCRAA
jgi:PAS domain S-box-containing protein